MYIQKTALCRKSIKQNKYKKEKIQVTGCMHGSATILSEGKVLFGGGGGEGFVVSSLSPNFFS